MDVDWCLSCERKLVRVFLFLLFHVRLLTPFQDDLPSFAGPYCSPQCLSYAEPSSSVRPRPLPLPESGAFRIRQWARAIPPHIPAGAPAHPFADLPLSPPSPLPSSRPPSPRPRPQPTPKLIERTAACTPLPTLCISSPAHVRPTHPPRAQSHSYAQRTPTTCMSEASTSLSSLLSEPMVATPDEDASFGANIGALVRCWVGRDRANSTKSTNQDWVIEKVTDYFPAMPSTKKTAPASKRPKKTPPPISAPVARPKRAVAASERDHATPTHSHTPTPVVFPSCRAWVDEDDVQDELLVAPQPQYHPAYFLKCDSQQHVASVQWTRAPSLSSSLSSSDSSVLLMAPRRADGVRGRKAAHAIVT